jgi:homoserine dehydrogenase
VSLRIALLGFGEVGQALARRVALGDTLHRIVSVTNRRGTWLRPHAAPGEPDRSWGWEEAVRRVEADVVVDALPTDLRAGERELAVARAAHKRGLPVVSAAKGGLAFHAGELRGLDYRASASVCGGTPALELLSGHAFRGDVLERFEGVLNGSTNHILTLLEEGASWDDAHADARARGILETDPSLDLLGLDAAAKAVILANHAWGTDLTLHDADAQGIVGLTAAEVREARGRGMAVRLVARGTPEGVSVAPVTLPRENPLAVFGKENALRLKFRDAGAITLRGPGAGGQETAAAVFSDILHVAGERKAAAQPLIVGLRQGNQS